MFMNMLEGMGRKYASPRSTVLDIKSAVAMVKEECSDSLNWWLEVNKAGDGSSRFGRGLFRGINKSGYAVVTDPTVGEPRKSANVENYATLLLSNLPSWSSMPSRERSIICTNDPSYSNAYGKTHVVFPFNGSSIGVAPTFDIFETNILGKLTFPELNGALVHMFTWAQRMKLDYPKVFPEVRDTIKDGKVSVRDSHVADGSWEGLVQVLAGIDKLVEADPSRMAEEFRHSALTDYASHFNSYSGILDYFSKNMSPEKSGIRYFNTNSMDAIPNMDYGTGRTGGNEIWVEGRSVLISPLGFASLGEMYQKLGVDI
jgi:hypothetical protein